MNNSDYESIMGRMRVNFDVAAGMVYKDSEDYTLQKQLFNIGDTSVSFDRTVALDSLPQQYDCDTGEPLDEEYDETVEVVMTLNNDGHTISFTESEVMALKKVLNNTKYIFEQ